jgi:radical SAM protein with 4Fe4S-binding SPASM domain
MPSILGRWLGRRPEPGVPICLAYFHEIVILADGTVTTCCFDAQAQNALGNINEMTLQEIWRERGLSWHRTNVEANRSGRSWSSTICNACFAGRHMVGFGARRTEDRGAIEEFHRPDPPLPRSLVIEPTASCNYGCWGCPTGQGKITRAKVLPLSTFKRQVLPVIPGAWQVRLYNYGESFLHPDIVEMLRSLRASNDRLRLDLSTNGVFMSRAISEALVECQANYLTVSLHGGHTHEGMTKYARRGVDLEAIRKNVQQLVEIKRSRGATLPWIFLKAILFDWNDGEEEMEDFLELGRELGVDLAGWDVNYGTAHSSRRVAPGTEAYRRLEEAKLLMQNFYERPAWP